MSALMRFARVSRRLQEMVYDDTRWVQKLKAIGVWNEFEARKRFEDAMQRKREALAKQTAGKDGAVAAAPQPSRPGSMTIFDAGEEERRQKQLQEEAERRRVESEKRRMTVASPDGVAVGLDLMTLNSPTIVDKPRRPPSLRDPSSLLNVLSSVKSIRGYARQEYGRIHGALGPLYFDLVKARTHTDPMIFRIYRDPEQQATMLAQLKLFAQADSSQGWSERLDSLTSMTSIFENAALREFEGGYEAQDIDGRMKRYAHVLIVLNGGMACVQLFVQKHPVMFERERLGNPMDCFE